MRVRGTLYFLKNDFKHYFFKFLLELNLYSSSVVYSSEVFDTPILAVYMEGGYDTDLTKHNLFITPNRDVGSGVDRFNADDKK